MTVMTLWRCDRCGHAVRAEEAPLHCGKPMTALAREMQREKTVRKPCCWKRR